MNVYFESKGTGDLNIKVDCMNLQETYVLEDCLYWDCPLIDKSSNYISVSSERGNGQASLTFNTDYYVLTGVNNNSSLYVPTPLPSKCSIELDAERNNINIGIAILKSNGDIWGFVKAASNYVNRWSYKNQSWKSGESYYFVSGISYTGYLHFKIIKDDSSIQLTVTNSSNEILLNNSFTLVSWLIGETVYAGAFEGNGGTANIKNFKIKAL